MSASYSDVATSFADTGLIVRGGFAVSADDDVEGATIIMIGNGGPEMWTHFEARKPMGADPLDTWTKQVVAPLALELGAAAIYPNDRPYRPFQQWAIRAESVFSSPLGILIHPKFGLWHAYRAALVFKETVTGLPDIAQEGVSPCNDCADKPCLATCPVNAFDGTSYDVPRCVAHLESAAGSACHAGGCLARLACPVARDQTTPPAQREFHTAAFFRSQGGKSRAES